LEFEPTPSPFPITNISNQMSSTTKLSSCVKPVKSIIRKSRCENAKQCPVTLDESGDKLALNSESIPSYSVPSEISMRSDYDDIINDDNDYDVPDDTKKSVAYSRNGRHNSNNTTNNNKSNAVFSATTDIFKTLRNETLHVVYSKRLVYVVLSLTMMIVSILTYVRLEKAETQSFQKRVRKFNLHLFMFMFSLS
jgi:hypothetical protein